MKRQYGKSPHEVIRRWVMEAWNRGNVEVAHEIYHPDFEIPDMAHFGEVLKGPVGAIQMVEEMRTAVPDIHFSIIQLEQDDDVVSAVFCVMGTPVRSMPPLFLREGEPFRRHAFDVWRFEGLLIRKRISAYFYPL